MQLCGVKTFTIHDYRHPGVIGHGFGRTVFVDLDETLISSISRQKRRRQAVLLADGDRYYVFPRPIAGSLLSGLRARFSRVVMLTMGDRGYALEMNAVFGFGFSEGDIIAFEDFAAKVNESIIPKTLTAHPGAILIDNEHPRERNAIVKRSFLGPALYVELRAFDGRPDPDGFPEIVESLFHQISPAPQL